MGSSGKQFGNNFPILRNERGGVKRETIDDIKNYCYLPEYCGPPERNMTSWKA